MAGVTLADFGGPVHPQETQNADGSVSVWCGMNLRDYFAAAALQGMLSDPDAGKVDWKDLAEEAYEAADAMLVARERKEGEKC
jgi:hypothetical protein